MNRLHRLATISSLIILVATGGLWLGAQHLDSTGLSAPFCGDHSEQLMRAGIEREDDIPLPVKVS